MALYDLLQERASVYEQMKALQDQYNDKPMDGADKDTYGNLEKSFDDLTKRIEARKRQDERDRLMGEQEPMNKKPGEPSLFAKALSGNAAAIQEYRNATPTLGDDAQAGSLTAPMEFRQELIKGLDDMLFMRTLARNVGTIGAAQSLGFPYRSAEATDAEWVGEIAAAPEENTLAYGRREFKPHRMAKLITLSRALVNHAPLAERAVGDEMRYRIAITQEKAYMLGDGQNKPLGLFTASESGISTARDVSTGNTATAVTFDGLIEAKYSIKEQYLRNASWIMHRDMAKMLAKIKDKNDQYVWQPSVQVGQPDFLLGRPVHMSEYAPNVYTAGNYAAIFGDMKNYWIVDADVLTIQVLKELYAPNSQIGYLFDYFGDGAPVLGEAFARVALAAS